jgi:hypothetical protein
VSESHASTGTFDAAGFRAWAGALVEEKWPEDWSLLAIQEVCPPIGEEVHLLFTHPTLPLQPRLTLFLRPPTDVKTSPAGPLHLCYSLRHNLDLIPELRTHFDLLGAALVERLRRLPPFEEGMP